MSHYVREEVTRENNLRTCILPSPATNCTPLATALRPSCAPTHSLVQASDLLSDSEVVRGSCSCCRSGSESHSRSKVR